MITSNNLFAQDHNKKIVDKYGQLIHADFVAKVTNDSQLVNDVKRDSLYFASLKPPTRDLYGGLLNSKNKYGLKATGFFHVQKLKARQVILVDPVGNAYFSMGVNGVGYLGDTYTHVKGRENIYEWLPKFTADKNDPDYKYNPAYLNNEPRDFSFYVSNRIRKSKYFDLSDFYKESVYRLRKWGFTSEGGFSNSPNDTSLYFPQVRFVELPSQYLISGSSLFDVYAKDFSSIIEKGFASQHIASQAFNPLIIGYFFGNEIDYHQFKNIIPSKKASEVATKNALVEFLQKKYHTIQAFNNSWKTSFRNFNELDESAISINTDNAINDMYDFFEIYLDKFYTTVIKELKKFDKNHLILGDRYFTAVMSDKRLRNIICKAAAKHLDVISYNYYTYGLDTNRLKDMYKISGKPIMITEFHYGDPTQGQTSSIEMMDNEQQKGEAYRNYVENLAATGFIVGAHWFEYFDQAVTGRWFQGYNGEGFGIGLLNVADRPYKNFLSSVMAANNGIYDLIFRRKKPFQYDFGPAKSGRLNTKSITIFRTKEPIVIDGIMDGYWPKGETITLDDKERITGISQKNSSATINLAYDANFLYVYAHIRDESPMTNSFHGPDIWNGDGIEIFVGPENPDKGGTIRLKDRQIVLSASKEKSAYHWYNNVSGQPAMPMVAKMDNDNKGYKIEAALPLSDLNITDVFKAKKIRFDIGFDNGDERQRNAQYMWNGLETNSHSREKWGILVLN